MAGQARYAGLGAFTGFDFNALHFYLVAHDIPVSRWAEVIEALNNIAEIGKKYFNRIEETKK